MDETNSGKFVGFEEFSHRELPSTYVQLGISSMENLKKRLETPTRHVGVRRGVWIDT